MFNIDSFFKKKISCKLVAPIPTASFRRHRSFWGRNSLQFFATNTDECVCYSDGFCLSVLVFYFCFLRWFGFLPTILFSSVYFPWCFWIPCSGRFHSRRIYHGGIFEVLFSLLGRCWNVRRLFITKPRWMLEWYPFASWLFVVWEDSYADESWQVG